jgi:hypothetical protein
MTRDAYAADGIAADGLCPRCERYLAEVQVRNERTGDTAHICSSCARLIEDTDGLVLVSDLPDPEDMPAAGGESIPTDVLLADVRRVDAATDGDPSRHDYREYGAYGATTIKRRFGGWPKALRAARRGDQ